MLTGAETMLGIQIPSQPCNPTKKARTDFILIDGSGRCVMTVPGRVQKTGSTPKPTRPAEDLTCDEHQVEDLLSEGESTDAEHDGKEISKQTTSWKVSP